ncbi:XrtA/PEP-CTERM system TPR-repeat protein PrsT [Niveibacterium sp. SC-1]|uniref:XrtA/PEP-CTERM system TPR-repeat protein PrsT n=1 Tax=Niveibacterium sp. SC-1 TaxID=3135646 RepID=UPI00311E81F6
MLLALTLAAPVHAADPKAARYYEDAQVRYDKRDYAGAVIQLKNALQTDRSMLAAQILLGKALLASGDAAGAEVALREARNLGVDAVELAVPLNQSLYAQGKYAELIALPVPANLGRVAKVDLLVIRGSAQVELGDPRAAARSFDEARAIDPKALSIMLADANQQLRSGDLARADALTRDAVAQVPDSAEAWSARATVLTAMGQPQPALQAYERALKLKPGAIEPRLSRIGLLIDLNRDADAARDVQALSEIAPDDARAAFLRAVLAARRGDSEAVASEMANVVKVIDSVPPDVRNRRASLLLLGGLAHYSLRNPEKARAALENFLRLQPGHPGATRTLASIYLDARDFGRASDLLEDYLRRNPRDPQALNLLSAAYLAQKRYAQAGALLQQAVDQGVQDANVQAALGASRAGQGQDVLAEQHLRKAFGRGGDPVSGYTLAVLLLQRGQGKEAAQVCDALVARDPRNPTLLNMQGLARAQQGDSAGAHKSFEAALAVSPAYPPALLNAARLDAAEGRVEQARKRLGALIAGDQPNIDALIELAQLEARAGRDAAARQLVERAQVLAPRNPRPALILVDVYLGRGDVQAALDTARTAAAAAPDNVAAAMALARVRIAAGDTVRARENLVDARKLAENDPRLLVEIARMQLQADHRDGAAYSLEKALSADPDFYPALELQAELALLARDFANAERLAKRMDQRFPNRAASGHILGDVTMARGQVAAGLAQHRSAYAREPVSASAVRVFRAYAAAGDLRGGVAFVREVIKAKGPDPLVLGALAEGQVRMADWQGAKSSYAQLLKMQGARPDLLNNQALVLLELSDPAALGSAEKAWKLAPADAGVVDTYGWVLARQGQLDKALGLLREARLRDPRNLEVRYHLAWTLAKTGRTREAREELAPALEAGGQLESAAAVRKLAEQLGG